MTNKQYVYLSFRPLAGIMVLIWHDVVAEAEDLVDEFPSPCGDYGSYRRRI